MNTKVPTLLLITLLFSGFYLPHQTTTVKTNQSKVIFEEEALSYTPRQKEKIKTIIQQTTQEVSRWFPTLPTSITFRVSITSENLHEIGGVNGAALTHSPAEIVLVTSNAYPGGIDEVIKKSLAVIVFHELHHLSRGCAIHDNHFSSDILTASINEGLAVVFAEHFTGVSYARFDYPQNIKQWVKEIIQLDNKANFDHWMFEHPDGRSAIGYKAGKYLVHQALIKSGKNILELSQFTPNEILVLSGFTTGVTPLSLGFLPTNRGKFLPFVENSTRLPRNPHP